MRRSSLTKRLAVGAAVTLVASLSARAPASASALVHPTGAIRSAASLSCNAAASGTGSIYPGPQASRVYDGRFANGPAVPDLNTHTPQGIANWPNWDGRGHTLLLVVAYATKGGNAFIYGLDPGTGRHVGTVQIAATHGGGIAVHGSWVFVSASGTSIRKYSASALRSRMTAAGDPYLSKSGANRSVHGASFLTVSGNYLYAGRFNSTGRDTMYSYRIAADGSLTTLSGYQVPTKTQGVAVAGSRFIFSTSYGRHNRGNIYVVLAGYKSLDSAHLYCFRAPSMNEGVTIAGNEAFVVYESGSSEYPDALNRITRVHVASVNSLANLV